MQSTSISPADIPALLPLEKDYFARLEGHTGLYVKVFKSGARTFMLKMKKDGRTYTRRLGSFPEMSYEQAVDEASFLRASIQGVHPDTGPAALTLPRLYEQYKKSRRFLKLGPASQVEYCRYISEYLDTVKSKDIEEAL